MTGTYRLLTTKIDGDYGYLIAYVFRAFGLLLSPWAIIASAITVPLGVVTLAAITICSAFALPGAFIKDIGLMVMDKVNTNHSSPKSIALSKGSAYVPVNSVGSTKNIFTGFGEPTNNILPKHSNNGSDFKNNFICDKPSETMDDRFINKLKNWCWSLFHNQDNENLKTNQQCFSLISDGPRI